MTMLKSRQIEQRIKLLQREASPQKQWKKRSFLSVQSSGDLKWSEKTIKRHSDAPSGVPVGYFANVTSPRGDVELATVRKASPVRSPFSPVNKVDNTIVATSTSASKMILAPRLMEENISPLEMISPVDKIYISSETKRIMRIEIEENLNSFPFTVSNLALLLQGSKEVIESIVDQASSSEEDDLLGLQTGLMTISLSEDESDADVVKRTKTEGYKAALRTFVTRGNNEWVNDWEECDKVLGEVFLWSRDVGLEDCGRDAAVVITEDEVAEVKEERKEPAAVVETELIEEKEERKASEIVRLASTPPQPPRRQTTPKKKSIYSKVLPKKALPSPVKAMVKSSMKPFSHRIQKKKEPSHLSLDSFRQLIQSRVGESKWNRVFMHRPTRQLTPIKRAEERLDRKITELEKLRTSQVDEVLARRQEEEAQRQASQIASSLLRSLTPDEESIVQKALYGIGPPNEILASHEADSVQRSSMQRLQPGQWVNDEIINYFLKNCLAQRDIKLCSSQPGRKRSHFFNSYFVQTMFDEKNNNMALRGKYAYKNVKRWSKKVPGKDIFNLKYIFCPINLDNMHWTSAVIFMEEKKIQYYDSLGGTDGRKLEGLLEYVKDEWRVKKGGEMDVSEWKLVGCTDDTPRQLNGYDCGVFTCMFADFISQDCPLVFDQKHVNQCRERIALSIMKNCAIE